MLIKENKYNINILDQLNEAVYLTEEEAKIFPVEITVRENSNIDCNTVLFEDVLRISGQYGCSLNEAIEKIAEANDIPSCLLAVDLKEDIAILYPEVVDEMYQVVISPISENDPVGVWVESVVNEAIEQDDESIVESCILDENTAKKIGNALMGLGLAGNIGANYGMQKKRKKWDSLGGKYGAELGMFRDPDAIDDRTDLYNAAMGSDLLFTTGAAIRIGEKSYRAIDSLYNKFKDRPRNVVAKVVSKLRKSYANIKKKLESSPSMFKKNPKMVTTLKKVGAKILSVIDKLLLVMQRGANQFS